MLEQCPHCRALLTEKEIEVNECDTCFQTITIDNRFNPFEYEYDPFTIPDDGDDIQTAETEPNFIPKDLD